MLTVYSVVILTLLSMTVGTDADIQFVLSANTLSWPDAAIACKSIHRSLAALDSGILQKAFDQDIKSVIGEKVWVGRYIGYSSPVAAEGCYQNVTLGTRITKLLANNNNLMNCLHECSNSLYIGMQGQHCYCLPGLSAQASPVSGTYCQAQCAGEARAVSTPQISQCGSQDVRVDTVSVFRKVLKDEIRLDKSTQGECIAYNVRARIWQPQACNLPKVFTCDRQRCTGPQAICTIESNKPATWFEARQLCEENGGRLSIVNTTTGTYLNQIVGVIGDALHWTGWHRQESIVWSNDSNLEELVQSDRCFAVARKPDGSWEWHIDRCDSRNKYACVQDTDLFSTTVSLTLAVNVSTAATTQSLFSTSLPFSKQSISSIKSSMGTITVDPMAKPVQITPSSGAHSAITCFSTPSIQCFLSIAILLSSKNHYF